MSSFPLLSKIIKDHSQTGKYGGKYVRMSAATLTAIKAMSNDLDQIKRVNMIPVGKHFMGLQHLMGLDIRVDEALRFGEWELRDKHDDSVAASEVEAPEGDQP